MQIDWISLSLVNFGVTMAILAVILMIINRLVTGGRVRTAEIIYRWVALFCLGFTCLFTFIIHVFYPELGAQVVGWLNSPFQYEAGIADLSFGLLGILSFNASKGFRWATVIGATIWLWGDALGHINQLIAQHNFNPGNAGSWLWFDILLPIVLLLCMRQLEQNRH